MKQLTSEPGTTRLSAGFVFALRRPQSRRRFLNSLRPEPSGLPLDLNEWEIVADLDPGMVDWDEVSR